jgi:hypothetical protein
MAYELPEDLGALTPDQLQTLIDAGLDALRALGVTDDSDDETLAEGERIVGLINQAQAAKTDKETRASRAQGINTVLDTPTEPEATPEEGGEEGGEGGEEAPETPETPPEEVLTPDEVLQPVAAGASPARRAAANAARPTVPATRARVASLTAAADVPGLPTGASLDGLTAASDALIRRMKAFPTQRIGGKEGVVQRYGAAVIHKQGFGELTQDNKDLDDYSLVWESGREARLPGGSLVAAGGWCTPSETLWDLCVFESVEGLLSLPEFQVTRGGIRWTTGPDFSDIYNDCGFFITNAQAEAGGPFTKTCCEVLCPPFEEIRLEAIGLCVTAPFLTNATWPELIRRFMEGALVAQQHKVNKYLIDQINAASGTTTTIADTGSLTLNMESIQFVAMGMRYRHRLGDSVTIEVVAPQWLRAMWIADLGMRDNPPASPEAYISQWFSDRNLSVQWVFDFQDPTVDGCAVDFANSVELLMYPAGTWSKGSLDIINLDAVYDSTQLQQNIFTALFVEEGILAVQRCTHTCSVTVPICVSGRTAARDISACLATASGVGVIPTGATAGTPGTWTPANAAAADDIDDLQNHVPAITASPATAWTTGQRVVLGDGTEAHWSGTAWVAGRKP